MNNITLNELYELRRGDSVTLDMGDFNLIVTRRADDWHVQLPNSYWNCDKHLDAAIGYAALTWWIDNNGGRIAS